MSSLNKIGLFFSAREKVLNNFKSRALPIINQDETVRLEPTPKPVPEPVAEPTPEPILELCTKI